jgi:trehalose synthase-fused probable maltokinase
MTLASRIADWLPNARWFAAKGEPCAALTLHDEANLADTDLAIAIVDVRSVAGAISRYVAPIDRTTAQDAAATAEFAGWLVRTVLGAESRAGSHGSFTGHPTPGAAFTVAGRPDVKTLGGDASNTSLLVDFGGRAFAVKLLRRCRAGTQPEVEVGRFLAEDSPFAGTPRLRGWLEYSATDASEPTAIATVHDFAPGCTSGWERLVALVADGGLAGPHRGRIFRLVAAIGRTTAAMHRALGSRPDIAAFAPAAVSAADRRATAAAMAAHARQTFDLVADRRSAAPAATAERLESLARDREALIDRLESIADLETSAVAIRVHGDYHLGQLLVGGEDERVFVIDFEGEPGRTLEERRMKTSVFKDVAGMCRSFDYLLRYVASTAGAQYRADDLRQLEACYLDAYREIAVGQPWWPAEPGAAERLLAIYKLDKALYELAYELQNRPDWVEVPLAALLRP